ncbi:glycosyltransferase family 2 protein [Gelidibacter salicanalis]|uniref:Glycosyltransferase family 2 protein n=1 Tax=Gelidibacter salicanalis TaxID=291193 RepID=A0A934KR55_9FLAO|nr:glycosyltransferase family 2 protein [Gelidibacter salicanalis]MBJ7880580.1 glycosyltransferase family 2 protein [Gelidibacter salicanalis]
MDVSIILVNYNTCGLTTKAIASVYEFTKTISFEIIMVDNNSVDDSVEFIRAKFPDVIIIENNHNLGFGRANNSGMEIANGAYFLLLNTDTYLLDNAIKQMFDFMENPINKKVSVVGAKLLKTDLSYNVSAGNFPSYRLFVKGSFLKYFYKKSFYSNMYNNIIPTTSKSPYEVDYVSGADFFVRSDVIKSVGGFDECFFMYGEDVELSYRIKKQLPDTRQMINPDIRIVHISQGSSNVHSESRAFKLRILNSTFLFYKITEGFLQANLYKIIGLKRLYF